MSRCLISRCQSHVVCERRGTPPGATTMETLRRTLYHKPELGGHNECSRISRLGSEVASLTYSAFHNARSNIGSIFESSSGAVNMTPGAYPFSARCVPTLSLFDMYLSNLSYTTI